MNAVQIVSLMSIFLLARSPAGTPSKRAGTPAERAGTPTNPTGTSSGVQDQFYALFSAGHKVGWMRITRTVQGMKVESFRELLLEIPQKGAGAAHYERLSHTETTAGVPSMLNYIFNEAGRRLNFTAEIRGTQVNFSCDAGGTSTGVALGCPQGVILAEGLKKQILRSGLKPGTTFTVPSLESPLTKIVQRKVTVGPLKEVEVEGRKMQLWELTETVLEGEKEDTTISWVDEKLWPWKVSFRRMDMDLEALACNRMYAEGKGDWPDHIKSHLLKSPQSLDNAASAKSITYQLVVPPGATRALAGGRLELPAETSTQRVQMEGEIATVTVSAVSPGAEVYSPQTLPASERKPERENPYARSDDPNVAALARQAIAGATTTAAAVQGIEGFVRKYLTLQDIASDTEYLTAAEAARVRKGDCTESAVLAASMCHSVGIPSRVVFGVMYRSEYAGQKQVFVAHAWAEAKVGNEWVPLDPATGGWDARRIALLVGGGDPNQMATMFRSLEQLQLTKVTVAN